MFWTTPEFPVVVKALNEGFLVTLQLFFVTIIGAVCPWALSSPSAP